MQHLTLNNGVSMPILGFGVYQISDPGTCRACVAQALSTGYRLIDTAAAYHNEEAVGQAIRESGIPRESIFVTTKLWIQDAGCEKTRKAFQRSLDRLGLDYLDLYLIHQPFGDVHGAWRAMEELHLEGRIRAIGVSNFQADRLVDLILHNEIRPAVNQMETHPFCQQRDLEAVLREYGVQLESWGPFAEGRNGVFRNPVLLALAEKHGRPVAQIILRWLIQRGVAAIPKSIHPERIAENFRIFDFALEASDMEAIAGLDTGASAFLDHRDPRTVALLSGMRLEAETPRRA